MTFNFKNILPKSADNNFKGHKLALWGFFFVFGSYDLEGNYSYVI